MTQGPITNRSTSYFASDVASDMTFSGHKITSLENGNSMVHKVPIFKAGTFRNSWGEQRTWTPEELAQMVTNFNLLKAKDILPNVPIRKDHSNSIEKVIGYFADISTDGEFLYADHEVTEPGELDKMRRGTYRSRSLEVGAYEDNTDAVYWPVVMGLAYVPLPAVEGLHSKDLSMAFFSRCDDPKESQVATETADDKGAKAPVSNHGAPAPFTFKLGGVDTTDYAAVQRHVETLEGTVKATIENGRAEFVKGLSGTGKITALQVDPFTKLAKKMSDEDFADWKAAYELAPKLPILSEHGSQDPNRKGPESGEVDPVDDAIAVQEGILKNFERTGMSAEDRKMLPAYATLQALQAQKNSKGA